MGAGTGARKNGGTGESAGTGAGRPGPLAKQRQNSLTAPVPALWPAPPFLPAPAPPALVWNSHFGVLRRPDLNASDLNSQSLEFHGDLQPAFQ